MYYTLLQWVLMFFTYSILGWAWESLYVSILRKRWVYRGFLHGPILPIYGFGAIIVLWVTMPFKDSIALVFILGSLGASILEYITGAMMEKIFHMRNWDYSHHKFNLDGYISLYTSIAWGLFSVLLLYLLHIPIEKAILGIPYYVAEPTSLVLAIAFVVDTTISIQSALDMKGLLKNITENNKFISALEIKINNMTSDINQTSFELSKNLRRIKEDINKNMQIYHSRIELKRETNKTFLLEKIHERENFKFTFMQLLSESIDTIIKEIQLKINAVSSKANKEQLSKVIQDLYGLKSELKEAKFNIFSRKDKEYHKAIKFFLRNPNSISTHYKEAFDEIKTLYKSDKKEI